MWDGIPLVVHLTNFILEDKDVVLVVSDKISWSLSSIVLASTSEKYARRPFESSDSQMWLTTFKINSTLSRSAVLYTAQSVRSKACAASFFCVVIVTGREPPIVSSNIFGRFGRENDVPCFVVYGLSSWMVPMRFCTASVLSYSMGYRIRERASKTGSTSESVGCPSIMMKASYASMNFAVISGDVVVVVATTSGRELRY